jgi:hypothetical protein
MRARPSSLPTTGPTRSNNTNRVSYSSVCTRASTEGYPFVVIDLPCTTLYLYHNDFAPVAPRLPNIVIALILGTGVDPQDEYCHVRQFCSQA